MVADDPRHVRNVDAPVVSHLPAESQFGLAARLLGEIDTTLAPTPRSLVLSNMVQSLDGAAALDGRSAGLAGPDDRRVFSALRTIADVVVVGVGTATAEQYRPLPRSVELDDFRRQHGRPIRRRLAIVTGRGLVDQRVPALTSPNDLIVVTCARGISAANDLAARFRGLTIMTAGDDRVEPELMVTQLTALLETGDHCETTTQSPINVLCEGGPTLLGSMVEANAIDHMFTTVGATIVGGDGPRSTNNLSVGRRPWSLRRAWVGDEGDVFLHHVPHGPDNA